MRRGYFDDFTDLKETGGRTFPVSEGLVPAESAPAFPVFTVRLRLSAALEESPSERCFLSKYSCLKPARRLCLMCSHIVLFGLLV